MKQECPSHAPGSILVNSLEIMKQDEHVSVRWDILLLAPEIINRRTCFKKGGQETRK